MLDTMCAVDAWGRNAKKSIYLNRKFQGLVTTGFVMSLVTPNGMKINWHDVNISVEHCVFRMFRVPTDLKGYIVESIIFFFTLH